MQRIVADAKTTENRLRPRPHRPVAVVADLTPAEKRAAAWRHPGWLVGVRLLRDAAFQSAVDAGPVDCARRYCPRGGQGQDAVRRLAEMCINAREVYSRCSRPFLVVEAQVSGWAAMSDEPVDKPSRFRVAEVERGAEVVARYGAHQCVECAAQLRAERAGELRCAPCSSRAAVHPSVRASDDRRIWRSRARALEALARVVR